MTSGFIGTVLAVHACFWLIFQFLLFHFFCDSCWLSSEQRRSAKKNRKRWNLNFYYVKYEEIFTFSLFSLSTFSLLHFCTSSVFRFFFICSFLTPSLFHFSTFPLTFSLFHFLKKVKKSEKFVPEYTGNLTFFIFQFLKKGEKCVFARNSWLW